MDILAWTVKNQGAWYGRAIIWLLYYALRVCVPKGILMNWMLCTAFVQSLHRLGEPEVIVCIDGHLNAGNQARELSKKGFVTFWLAGTVREQNSFREAFGIEKKLFQFSTSENTLDQAEKIVEKAQVEELGMIGYMDYESHATRTTLTLVKQALNQDANIQFVPYVYTDSNRKEMFSLLRELGVLLEAIKLYRYQLKGDVASLQEAINYYQGIVPEVESKKKRETAGLIAIHGNSLLLVYKRDVWIPPGGKPEIGESLEACLLRECSEELPGSDVSELKPYGYWEAIAPHKGDMIGCWVFMGEFEGVLDPSREITDARWIENSELDDLPLSASVRQIVATLRFTGHLL